MAGKHGMERLDMDMVLEGGSIDVNGKELLLTTEQCLLNKNRNPEYIVQTEHTLRQSLGVKQILWLQGELSGDDTDGHVDNLARFVDDHTIVCGAPGSANGPNHNTLSANITLLEKYAAEHDLRIIEVPMPGRKRVKDVVVPASYLNFLIINGAVLVPVFQDPADEPALCLFEKHFPGRKIIPLDCTLLGYGLGGIHCVTMQVPLPPL